MVVQVDFGFSQYSVDTNPCGGRFVAREVLVGGKLKVYVSAGTVGTGRAVSSYKVVAVDGKVVAFNHDGFVFVIKEVHEPVIDLGHVLFVAHNDVYVVVVEVLSVFFYVIRIFKIGIMSLPRCRCRISLRSGLRLGDGTLLRHRRRFRLFGRLIFFRSVLHGFPGDDLPFLR